MPFLSTGWIEFPGSLPRIDIPVASSALLEGVGSLSPSAENGLVSAMVEPLGSQRCMFGWYRDSTRSKRKVSRIWLFYSLLRGRKPIS